MFWLISSCAGGGYRERRITTEECEEITDRNTIARRLGYSDFEANDSFRDDFCFDREYFRSAKPRTEDGGKLFIYPLPILRVIIIFVVFYWSIFTCTLISFTIQFYGIVIFRFEFVYFSVIFYLNLTRLWNYFYILSLNLWKNFFFWKFDFWKILTCVKFLVLFYFLPKIYLEYFISIWRNRMIFFIIRFLSCFY